MPQITTRRNNPKFFHEQWDVSTEEIINGKRIKLNFHRINFIPSWTGYVADFQAKLGWSTTSRIAVIGATFGMVEELLKVNHGYTSVVSCDDSNWVQRTKNTGEDEDVRSAILGVQENPFTGDGLAAWGRIVAYDQGVGTRTNGYAVYDENLLTNQSRVNVKSLLGGQVDYVFTDDLLDFLTPDEAAAFSAEAKKLTGVQAIQHAVAPPGQAPEFRGFDNTGTLTGNGAKGVDYWKTLLPGDVFYDWGSGSVV